MVLMRHVLKRDGIWWVRINIPADLQAKWGKTEEWRSLKTSDDLEAMQAAPTIIAEIKGRIAAMRLGGQTVPAPQAAVVEPIRLTPERAISLIERWRNTQLEAAYVQAYNGELAPIDGDERALRSERMYALSQPSPWDRIKGFNENHAAVIGAPLDHPALRHSRGLLADAWLDMEREIERQDQALCRICRDQTDFQRQEILWRVEQLPIGQGHFHPAGHPRPDETGQGRNLGCHLGAGDRQAKSDARTRSLQAG